VGLTKLTLHRGGRLSALLIISPPGGDCNEQLRDIILRSRGASRTPLLEPQREKRRHLVHQGLAPLIRPILRGFILDHVAKTTEVT